MIIIGAGADTTGKNTDARNKQVILKNCAPFTDCFGEIDNTQGDNTRDLHVLMPMHNLRKYSYNYAIELKSV